MERINFREVGDLGKLLPKSAQFFRQNFISILKSSLLVVLIPFVLGAFLTATSMSGFYSELGGNMDNPETMMNPFSMMTRMLPGYFLTAVSFMLFYIICIAYIKHYVAGEEIINQNSVLKEVKKHFFKVLLGGILTVILVYIGFMFCLIPGIYLAVVLSHLFVIAIVEDLGFGKSFSKAFKLIKGKWWDSFLLYFVSTLIVGGISFIMVLPMYVFMFAGMFKSIENENPEQLFDNMSNIGWFVPFYMIVYLVIIMLTATIHSVNYFNLVEAQEGVGEKSKIENFGN